VVGGKTVAKHLVSANGDHGAEIYQADTGDSWWIRLELYPDYGKEDSSWYRGKVLHDFPQDSVAAAETLVREMWVGPGAWDTGRR
jgi:hypothetical protein